MEAQRERMDVEGVEGTHNRSEMFLVLKHGQGREEGQHFRRGRRSPLAGHCLHVPAGKLSSQEQTWQWAESYPSLMDSGNTVLKVFKRLPDLAEALRNRR